MTLHQDCCAMYAKKIAKLEEEDPVEAKTVQERYDALVLDKEFLEEALGERKTMNCVQSRATFVGHKLGLKGLAFKWVDEKNAMLITGCQDQSAKLFSFEIPNPNAVLKWNVRGLSHTRALFGVPFRQA